MLQSDRIWRIGLEYQVQQVLIVDDEPRILKFLSLKLVASGFTVLTATAGQEALDKIHNTRPDIIIMDIIMPGMDGVETLRLMREVCNCPVMLFSARDHNTEEINSLGADDYMRKPFDPDELVLRVRALLDPQKAAQTRPVAFSGQSDKK
jgi:DNA-binding response OmpR family regulator